MNNIRRIHFNLDEDATLDNAIISYLDNQKTFGYDYTTTIKKALLVLVVEDLMKGRTNE